MDEPWYDDHADTDAGITAATTGEAHCPRCNKPVDPLRATRVAIFDWRFYYFCSRECHDAFDLARATTSRTTPTFPDVIASLHASRSEPGRAILEPATFDDGSPIAVHADTPSTGVGESATAERPPTTPTVATPTTTDSITRSTPAVASAAAAYERSQLWLGIAFGLAALDSVGLFAGGAAWVLYGRCALAIAAALALGWAERLRVPSSLELDPFTTLAAPVGATLLFVVATLARHPLALPIANLTVVLIAALAASSWSIRRERRESDLRLVHLLRKLGEPTYRVDDGKPTLVEAHELHPGHEIVTEAGATLAVDAQIIAGRVTVEPWFEAERQEDRAEGTPLVAGARILAGRARAIVSWAADDRAFIRLIAAPQRSGELHTTFARLGWLTATRISWALASIFVLGALTADGSAFEYLALAFAAHACLANPAVRQGAAMQARRTALHLLQHGIAFRDAAALDKAGRVSTAALCARGTLLLGEPEIASIETLGAHSVEEVLGLAAGAETAATHPSAIAVRRAARARNIVPDASRSPDYTPGLGVTAVSATGKALIVGNRALMLKHRVGVAVAEKRIVELESTGRSVLLVALDGHLIGVIGLQDGLCAGARAAVQHLIDVGVEPVLLSGDARETCEALGRAVDIHHIRPEVLPADRGKEIRRLADGGAVVAVIGRSPTDDLALAAADVSVVLAAAGSTSAEWSAELASDNVRDAAYALRVAHFARREIRLALVMPAVAGLLGLLAAVIAMKMPLCPIFAAIGAALFLIRYRTTPPPGSTLDRAQQRAPIGLG